MMTVPSSPSCLFIIDVQKGFINGHTKHIPAIVEQLQSSYDHVFVSRFFNPDPSLYRDLMNWYKFRKETPDVDLAFSPISNAFQFDKEIYSCLLPSVLDELGHRRIKEVHLCGIATECCILKTAVDLFEKNFRPVVLTSGCASHAGAECHQAGLIVLQRLIGRDQIR